ncbi:MAG: thiol peroxidase [Planctomycetes bacterium]|nr:thiol peroxidase [Planctomycetota bacterium]
MTTAKERSGLVTLKGNPMTLLGPEVRVGDPAPDFKLLDGSLAVVTLASSSGKVRVLSVVPSLDTPVCDQQTKMLEEKAAGLPLSVAIYSVSVDLPFAQKRWCAAAESKRIVFLSDHREASFGAAYGVLMKENRLLARAVFVVGKDDRVKHVEIVKEVATLPDLDAAVRAAGAAAKG